MPRSAYPTDTDLISFLTGVQLWDAILAADVVGYAAAAADRFEKLTGRAPFLADASDVQVLCDPPGARSRSFQYPFRGGTKLLEFDTGFVSITSISLGVSADNPAVSPSICSASVVFSRRTTPSRVSRSRRWNSSSPCGEDRGRSW